MKVHNKTAEVRFNDRDFQIGDILFLQGHLNGEYTGRDVFMKITHILDDETYMKPGWVMLSMKFCC